jgi:hypothetical protein
MSDDKMQDLRSELEMYADMWDEAEAFHPPIEQPKPASTAADAEREKSSEPSMSMGASQDCYYDYLPSAEDDQMLTEEKMTTPNPVYPDSAGPDFATTPPVWASEDLLKTVEGLKDKLFDVENRLAKEMGGGEKWVEKVHDPDQKKILGEIESLKQRIEKVSSTLGTDHEPSPWVVQRD